MSVSILPRLWNGNRFKNFSRFSKLKVFRDKQQKHNFSRHILHFLDPFLHCTITRMYKRICKHGPAGVQHAPRHSGRCRIMMASEHPTQRVGINKPFPHYGLHGHRIKALRSKYQDRRSSSFHEPLPQCLSCLVKQQFLAFEQFASTSLEDH